ncbi:hypothetical protein OESDEN_01269 [Oesophagostomum dentatum]|uniref:Uncharacterized protein n=1 Tax=Oesophagostomum dentatum TaxID=61180 RepID=A0A0B1TRL9_OESDE|nr:hypothetical protein OESDEN_01269 [Oesophagostomum dentatum]
MAELQVFKAKINNARSLLKANESQVQRMETPFTFPESRAECENYIRMKTGETTHLLNAVENAFRQHELKQQTLLLNCSSPSISSESNVDTPTTITSRSESKIKIRKPVLEIPTFSGNFREFNIFWTVFDSLIHSDDELSDVDKFLFLKQALKGKAAVAISCIPVVGDRYQTAVDILTKHFDRTHMADILINEMERLQKAPDTPRSCRETFDAISSRIIHLEQTGMKMNADRVWRRIILSEFPEFICSNVIQREAERDEPFDVNEILDAIDRIITLRETASHTTETLFSEKSGGNNFPRTTTAISRWEEATNLLKKQKGSACADNRIPHTIARDFHLQKPDAWKLEDKKHVGYATQEITDRKTVQS